MIEQGLLHVDLCNIRFLRLQSFNDESDALSDVFFSRVPLPNIKELVVADSAFEGLFHSQRPHMRYYAKILSQLNKLELRGLHKLNSIGFEHTWVAPFLENLQDLKVLECSCLTNLAPSIVSFSNLTWLNVEDCARLEYLFTSSTAKSLDALVYLHISKCESLETVVAQEEGDKPDKDMTFPKLDSLHLSKLPKLGRFHTGKSTLNFPGLCEVRITQCKRLEYLFTSSTAKSLDELFEMDISNCESLETVVAAEGDEPNEDVTFRKLQDLSLRELPKLGSFYAGKSTLNFPNLWKVRITNCKRLEYLFTSSTAKSLDKLSKMDISNCESLETVVAAEGDKPDEDVTLPNLWTLSLSELPKLGSFYTGKSTLKFSLGWLLSNISITQCKSMKTFSHDNILPKKLWVEIDGLSRYDDLNTIVRQQFEKGSSTGLA